MAPTIKGTKISFRNKTNVGLLCWFTSTVGLYFYVTSLFNILSRSVM
jgi:hypothetical protein